MSVYCRYLLSLVRSFCCFLLYATDTLHYEVVALSCVHNHNRLTTIYGPEQRFGAANRLLNVSFPQQCVHQLLSDGFKSSPSQKSMWVQTCTLLQPPLHLIFSNYKLLERRFSDASLPPPS